MGITNFFYNKIFRKLFYAQYVKHFYKAGKNVFVEYPRKRLVEACISIDDNSFIFKNARIEAWGNEKNKSPKLYIGKNCGIHYDFTVLLGDDIIIEDDTLIASDVLITSENHQFDPTISCSYMYQKLSVAPVHIEKGVWVGEKVIILPGVTIGEKSVIGAGAVVTKNIPSYSMAVGNPARVIKKYNFEKKLWEKINESN